MAKEGTTHHLVQGRSCTLFQKKVLYITNELLSIFLTFPCKCYWEMTVNRNIQTSIPTPTQYFIFWKPLGEVIFKIMFRIKTKCMCLCDCRRQYFFLNWWGNGRCSVYDSRIWLMPWCPAGSLHIGWLVKRNSVTRQKWERKTKQGPEF